ncbi:MAG: CdaR family protein [Ignavibacteria bacterium]|jgi:hypothetical protein|nr:CdaR family protein [Ignavibacteria bacterium]MDH7528472.1 CdaR family protein [Ignavibacteria bacterium]
MKKEFFVFIIFVFIAFLFWGAISLSEEYSMKINIPVKVELPEGNFAIEGDIPENLEILLKASGWSLLKIKYFQDSKFILKIKEPVDNFVYPTNNITGDLLGFPGDVRILSIQPDVIRISFHIAIEKKVKIYPRLNFTLKDGYDIVSPIKVEPESIWIKGSRRLLAKIDSLPTELINLQQLSEFVSVETKVIDTLPNLLIYEKYPVKVSFDVQQIVDRDFEKIHIDLINVPKNRDVILLPSFIDAKLRGGINILGSLQPDSIKVTVDFQKYSLSSEEIKPEFNLPYGVKVLDYFPKQFKLIVRK